MFNAGILNMVNLLGLLTPPAGAEYMALVPGAIVAMLALIVILVDTFHRPGTRRDYLAYVSAVGLGIALMSCYVLWDNTLPTATFHGMLYLDKFSLFFAGIACLSGMLSLLQVPAFLQFHRMDRGEFYMLVLFSVVGAIFMANAADLLTLFIALEVMSIPVYCLAGFMRRESRSAEAAMKYFILGAFSAAIMLYGMALIYGATGTTNLEFIGKNLGILATSPDAVSAAGPMIVLGVILVVAGFAFKVAAAPFHLWTPDVYTGSPAPGVGFMATAVKAGAFAAMLRVCFIAFDQPFLRGGFYGLGWVDLLFFFSAASMIVGNAVAITQTNVKRMLAYSSIAHAGYILLGITAAGSMPELFLYNDTVLFYMLTYTFGTVGAFGVLSYLGRQGQTVETYDDLAGLGIKYPLAGVVMGVFMFSSAGVPPTAGFVAKLYVFRAAVDAGTITGDFSFIGLAILGVLTSVAGAYYYLKVLVQMYMRPVEKDRFVVSPALGVKISIVVCALASLIFGVMPGLGIQLSREAVVDFQGTSSRIKATQLRGKEELKKIEAEARKDAADAAPADTAAPVDNPPQG